MIVEFLRILGLLSGWPVQLLLFKRKTYYENGKKVKLKRGGKLIVSNHYNMLDYVMSCFMVFPRKLHVVTSEHPYKNRFFRFGMKFFGTIKADRETKNMSFVSESVRVIKQGKLVQIFPEGRNTPDGKLQPFFRSYILIAHRANAPIVPVVTDGNYGLFKRARVMIGQEIRISDILGETGKILSKVELERVNGAVYQKIAELRAELEKKKKKGAGK
ncbi:MAG: 1-acyl-sn-glycerol-3-phosphate acyltransferase [Clostridia bacterium]|nr:1-acyl-sn-glycerol-3-phosphate acyltransferase [Clostridia bacterium]